MTTPIRRAQPRDIPDLTRLLVQVNMVHHNGRPDLFKGPTTKYTESELSGILQNPETPVFVYDDGAVRGYAFCVLKHEPNSRLMTGIRTLYLDDLCVDESSRGTGIGRALYESVKEYAKNAGCYNLTLNVWACNPSAKAFYENRGLLPQKYGMEAVL